MSVDDMDRLEARGLSNYNLRQRIIQCSLEIDKYEGRATADESASLDLALDRLDAALYEHARRNPAEGSINAEHLSRQFYFSQNTFGPGARTKGVINHIEKELIEIKAHPEDVSEWADLIILGFDGALRQEHSPQAIIDAIIFKQGVNEQREWPDWRTADPDQAIEHVR